MKTINQTTAEKIRKIKDWQLLTDMELARKIHGTIEGVYWTKRAMKKGEV